jgi:hypothetical protein
VAKTTKRVMIFTNDLTNKTWLTHYEI